jgi:uncharacterized protein with PhoU and TrkA domain
MEPVSRDVVEHIAKIVGESSGAQQALKDLDTRLGHGENVCIYRAGKMWIVGPAPRDKTELSS